MKGKFQFLAGLMLGIAVVSCMGAAAAVANTVSAVITTSPIYLDGELVLLRGYNIAGSNYFMLRDIAQALDFNVYWDSDTKTIQIESDAPYTGQEPQIAADVQQVRLDMIDLINGHRRAGGVAELAMEQSLMDAAQECSSLHYSWHHTQVECETVAKHGYPYGFGSNLTVFTGAAVSDIAKEAVENWVNSPGHFQTMMDPAADTIGVGVTVDQGITYCYLFVGKPNSYNFYN